MPDLRCYERQAAVNRLRLPIWSTAMPRPLQGHEDGAQIASGADPVNEM